MKTIFNYEWSWTFASAEGVSRVVNRKKYDTDTADLLWRKEYEEERSEYYYVQCGSALFRKQNGEYFEYYVEWHKRLQNNVYYPTVTIKPLTEEEAKNLTEKYAPDDYIDIFGDVDE